MFRHFKPFLVVAAVLSASCDRVQPQPASSAPVPVPVQQAARGHRWGDPFDWVNNPPSVERIDFGAMSFEEPSLRRKRLRWEAAAEGMACKGWHHESWYRLPAKSHSVVRWWSTSPQYVDPQGYIEGDAVSKPCELHHIRMECYSNTDVLRPDGAILTAEWMPLAGWGVRVYWGAAKDDAGHVMLHFTPRGDEVASRQGFNFFPGLTRWEHQATFEGVNYHIQVALPEAAFDGGAMSAPLGGDQLRLWSSSVDAFRDAGLEMLDELERSIVAEIQSGAAIRMVSVTVVEGGTDGGDPPRYHEEPVERALAAEEEQAILDAMLMEVSQRRKIFRENYAGMYSALERVFPLSQLSSL